MKKLTSSLVIALAVVAFLSTGIGAATAEAQGQGQGVGLVRGTGKPLVPPTGELDLEPQEVSDFQLLLKEEKFMRDVYIALYAKWHASIFYTIALAEQNHTNILEKILPYIPALETPLPLSVELRDDAPIDTADVETLLQSVNATLTTWTNTEPQSLSLGAYLEELDILSLLVARSRAAGHTTLTTAYDHLLECSRNHLRAFVSCLEKLGVPYTPVLLPDEVYIPIMAIRN